MRESDMASDVPGAGTRPMGYWPEVALCALALPAVVAEAGLWTNHFVGRASPGPWFLVQLLVGFAATAGAVILAPVVAALCAWGIFTRRWRGLHAVGAYALAVLSLRVGTAFLIPYVAATPGGGGAIVSTFAVLFVVVVPLLYFVASRTTNRSGVSDRMTSA